jgi:hypothetical protein
MFFASYINRLAMSLSNYRTSSCLPVIEHSLSFIRWTGGAEMHVAHGKQARMVVIEWRHRTAV